MQRSLFGMAVLLAALLPWLGSTPESVAQSKPKLGGPTVELDGMKSQVFDFFKPQKADSPLLYKFQLPKDLKSDQDMADLTISEVTGKPDDVIAGWKGKWTPPKNFTIDKVSRTETFKVGDATVTRFTVQGAYDKNGKKFDDFRMVGYVFAGKNKEYGIELIGPFKTVGLHMPNMDAWVKAFK
jgi:hypothetical protein